MTCPTLALGRNALRWADATNPARAVTESVQTLRRLLTGEGTFAQLTRFAFVGLTSSLLYAVTFLTFGSMGSLAANLMGMLASTVLANELHRRLTFHASMAVGWLRAQVEGGGLSIVGLLATSSALVVLQAAVPDAGWLVQILMIGAITGTIGLVRFAALRTWVFTAARRARVSVPGLVPQH